MTDGRHRFDVTEDAGGCATGTEQSRDYEGVNVGCGFGSSHQNAMVSMIYIAIPADQMFTSWTTCTSGCRFQSV